MRKIKIVHIQLLPLLSGAQNVMINILESLEEDKYDIYVISKPGSPLVDKIKELGFHYIPVPSLRRELSLFDSIAFVHFFLIFRK
ncbi:MAG: glycosyltransferase family 1 protein, partial [FCB group bacterium]|nr:glycosyltransferase family 1 protein [FCB group bacterium]